MDDGLSEVRALLQPDEALVEKVVSTSNEWQGKIFSVEHDEVVAADGVRGWREIVRHHGGAGVVAVRDGRICLVRQWRVAQNRMTLEIPAGKLDAGETGADCAARELAEETGLVACSLEPLVSVLGSPGFTDEHTDVFVARSFVEGAAAPDAGEVVRVVWLPAGQVLAAIFAGLIRDGKTVSGVLAAVAKGMLE
jgi:ADP-ribose pyrophosphatase